MQKVSNSLEPYKYVEINDNGNFKYVFCTDSEIDYQIYFTDQSKHFEIYPNIQDDIISFGFAPIDKNLIIKRRDKRVQDTIFHFLGNFANRNPDKVLFVIMSGRHGLQRNRHIVFSQWHREFCSVMALDYHKFSLTIPGERDVNTYIAMYVPHTYHRIDDVRNALVDMKDELISKGYPPSVAVNF